MNNREMLKEAIADAKAVKEMAIANAKAALEEAFNPQLKSMLADKLMEMEDMDEGAEEEVEEGYGKEEVEERLGTINDPDSREPHGNLEEEEMVDDEMDLDEILAEIEKELDESSTEDITENEDGISEAEEEEEEAEEAEETETKDEDEEIDLDDMSEDDLKSFIEDVIADMVKAGELEAGEEVESDDEEDVDVEIEDEEEAEDAEAEIEEGYKDKMKEEKEDMEMEELAGQVESLKKEINEINLLNSKLLYVNKIFRSKNLTESQKTKVLGAFDKAQSVKEVKLVFETISENLSTTKKSVVRENLGRASKPAGMSTRKPIMEVDSQVSRWQKLAGIK